MAKFDSILDSVKHYCLVPTETKFYDAQLCDLINSQLNTVKQLLKGFAGYVIADESETWGDIGIEDESLLAAITDYIKISVNLKFDPPQNSYLVNLRKDQLAELEWRICNDHSCTEE